MSGQVSTHERERGLRARLGGELLDVRVEIGSALIDLVLHLWNRQNQEPWPRG